MMMTLTLISIPLLSLSHNFLESICILHRRLDLTLTNSRVSFFFLASGMSMMSAPNTIPLFGGKSCLIGQHQCARASLVAASTPVVHECIDWICSDGQSSVIGKSTDEPLVRGLWDSFSVKASFQGNISNLQGQEGQPQCHMPVHSI